MQLTSVFILLIHYVIIKVFHMLHSYAMWECSSVFCKELYLMTFKAAITNYRCYATASEFTHRQIKKSWSTPVEHGDFLSLPPSFHEITFCFISFLIYFLCILELMHLSCFFKGILNASETISCSDVSLAEWFLPQYSPKSFISENGSHASVKKKWSF